MAGNTQDTSVPTYWIEGEPFNAVYNGNNTPYDTTTQKYWFNSQPFDPYQLISSVVQAFYAILFFDDFIA